MSNIKYIDYDCSDVDNIAFDKKLDVISNDYYRIDNRSLLVNYQGSAKDLYDNLEPLVKGKNALIFEINYPDYFGYHNSSLWDWLNDHFGVKSE